MGEKNNLLASRRGMLCAFFFSPFALWLRAAEQSQANHSFTISATVRRVLLDVSVRNNHGAYITGLVQSDFQVFEDGRPQPILHFEAVDTPVTIGLIVDDSGSMREKRPAVIMAGLAFAKESNPKDEFFVVNFNDSVRPGLPPGTNFSDNLQTLRAALYMGRPEGKTALYDAIGFGLLHLRKGVQPKKALIVVSDGGDNASAASESEILSAIRASEATIYTVGLFTEDDPDRNPRALRKIAHLSGGDYFNPQTAPEVLPVFQKIAKDIRNRYTIAYAPDPKLDPVKDRVRKVRVTANASGQGKLVVRTRSAYSLGPAPAAEGQR
jgi:VWFA-related protein